MLCKLLSLCSYISRWTVNIKPVIKIPVLWDSTSRTLANRYWYFRETYCLCLQCRGTFLDIYKFPASKFCSEVTFEMKCYMLWAKLEGSWVSRICRLTRKWLFKLHSAFGCSNYIWQFITLVRISCFIPEKQKFGLY